MSKTWKQFFLVFAFLSTGANGHVILSCPSERFDYFKDQLQMSNCLEAASKNWTTYQTADIFNQLRLLTAIIQTQQETGKTTEILGLLPANCFAPVVHRDGGLLCVSSEKKIYCKPMCNTGYDFNFIRRSRLYEECSAATQNKWTTQYMGGNKLAECTKSPISVAGAPSAFFPKEKDCHKTKSDEELMKNITSIFHSELIKAGVTSFESSCLLCGETQSIN
ncbi:uncharacterized protein [Paramisgurnus dabryanus]|uniref:uncharacterized protein isoform X3 n=1 Tax=Paramisgurnus dabryanus TaxID=90735 RepID=UPI0031F3EAC6